MKREGLRFLVLLALPLLLSGCPKTTQLAIEYVTVRFPEGRPVYIDSEKNGRTNDVLRVERGTHVFHLGPEADYLPASYTVLVKGTSSVSPMVIEFRRK